METCRVHVYAKCMADCAKSCLKSEGIVFSKFISVEPLTLMDLFWFYNLIPVQAPDKHRCHHTDQSLKCNVFLQSQGMRMARCSVTNWPAFQHQTSQHRPRQSSLHAPSCHQTPHAHPHMAWLLWQPSAEHQHTLFIERKT